MVRSFSLRIEIFEHRRRNLRPRSPIRTRRYTHRFLRRQQPDFRVGKRNIGWTVVVLSHDANGAATVGGIDDIGDVLFVDEEGEMRPLRDDGDQIGLVMAYLDGRTGPLA